MVASTFEQKDIRRNPYDVNSINLGTHATLKARIGWQGLTTAEYLDSGSYYLVTGTDFQGGRVNWDTCHYVDKERYDQDPNIQLKNGDVLITKDGTIGKIGYVDDLPGPATLNSGVFVTRPLGKKFDPLFLYYILTSRIFEDFLLKLSAGSTISHLYQKDFVNFEFIIPVIEEQRAIAEALSDVDALIAALDKLIAKKRDIKIATMQQLLTSKKRLQGFSGKWNKIKLGQLAKVQRGASPRPISDPIWFDETSKVGWVRISDITKSGIYLHETTQNLSALGIQNSRPVAKGNLIMSICATVGRPIITGIDTCIHDGFVVFDNLQGEKHFFYNLLRFIENDWSKYGQIGSQMNLNTGLINQTEVLIPPTMKEQIAVAELLGDMDNDIDELDKLLEKTKAIKIGMMQKLLTGRIRLV